MQKCLVMLGAAMECPGGISAVVHCYRNFGLFNRWDVRYVSTFETPRLRTQIVVMLKALWSLSELLLRRQVALVHVHSASRGSFWRKSVCCAVSRMFGVPYIFHIHSGEFPVFYSQECGFLGKYWVRLTLRRAVKIIALTETWRQSLSNIAPSGLIEVIGNPIEVRSSLPGGRVHARRVLFLGRLREKKGIFDLVRALPSILKRAPDTKFVLAGDGDADAVRALAMSLQVASAIQLPGWIDGVDKDNALAEADVLVLPSYFEGLPICILEAMANGVAVVATNVGGIPDVIDANVTGLLVNPGDVQGLADAILALITDSELRARIREAGFDRVRDRYSAASTLQQLERCYSSILDGSG